MKITAEFLKEQLPKEILSKYKDKSIKNSAFLQLSLAQRYLGISCGLQEKVVDNLLNMKMHLVC